MFDARLVFLVSKKFDCCICQPFFVCLLQACLLKEKQAEFEKAANKSRFIDMVASRRLVLHNRKNAEIVQDMLQLGFVQNTSADSADGKEASAKNKQPPASFDYLLRMPISSLTLEKVEGCFSC